MDIREQRQISFLGAFPPWSHELFTRAPLSLLEELPHSSVY